jgi:hypothetical protein
VTNRLALILGVLIVLAITLDLHFGWGASVFIGRKVLELMDRVAVWR